MCTEKKVGKVMGKFLKYLACFLVFIGALNWGLVGLFRFDLVAYLFGNMTFITRIIYILVGLSSIFGAIMCYLQRNDNHCERCEY